MAKNLFNIDDALLFESDLNEEDRLIMETARDYAQSKLEPRALKGNTEEYFDREIAKEMGEMGLLGVTIPEEYGGAGLDQISYGLIMQEIERGVSGVRSTASVQSSLVMYPIFKFGSEAQRKTYLPKLASGEFMGCFGLTEPDHGSNPGGMVTNFKDKGDHYILNGAKMWISNAPFADIAVVWAKDESGRIHGLIVERGMEGFSTTTTHNKWSLRASATGELIFDNVKVPIENLIGKEGEGFKIALATLDGGRIGIASQALGIAQAALNASVSYSNERIQFGKPISKNQAIQFKIADMGMEIEAARLLIRQAAWKKDQKQNYGHIASMAKVYASEVAMRASTQCVQIHGGFGYMRESGIERLMRDAKITQIYEGTSEIQRVVIARELLKK